MWQLYSQLDANIFDDDMSFIFVNHLAFWKCLICIWYFISKTHTPPWRGLTKHHIIMMTRECYGDISRISSFFFPADSSALLSLVVFVHHHDWKHSSGEVCHPLNHMRMWKCGIESLQRHEESNTHTEELKRSLIHVGLNDRIMGNLLLDHEEYIEVLIDVAYTEWKRLYEWKND